MNKKQFRLIVFIRGLLIVFNYLFIGVAGLATLAGIVCVFLPKSIFEIDKYQITHTQINLSDVFSVTVPLTQIEDVNFKMLAIMISFSTAIALLIVYNITRQLKQILDTLKDNKPFEKDNPKRILKIGVTLIVLSIVKNIFAGLIVGTLLHLYSIDTISVNYSLDSTLFFCGLLVIILSGVFQHGTYLQEEYDATL